MKNNELEPIEPVQEEESQLLSAEILEAVGFKKVSIEESPFKDRNMPYYVKDGVLLFYNEGEWNKNSYYIGYGEMRMGVYGAVAFRWIKTLHELSKVYNAITGNTISRLKSEIKELKRKA